MSSYSLLCTGLLVAVGLLTLPGRLAAQSGPADICITAATVAAEQTGVPAEVLLAITMVETGRARGGETTPWPWTVNAGGTGSWFDTRGEAEAHVQALLDQGATNIDLGCFQLNYRWHARNFSSVADMLDPVRNAGYAAEYLRGLHQKTGDWGSAAAAYHSATPEYAARYRTKFDAAYAALQTGEVLLAEVTPHDRTNGFPLLIAGQSGRFGSLVPSTRAATPLFGTP